MKPLTTLGETPTAMAEAPLSGSTANSNAFLKAKFLLCAGFGLFMFLCPLGGDGFNGASAGAGAAVNAGRRVDHALAVRLGYRACRAVLLARAAADALFRVNLVCHFQFSFLGLVSGVYYLILIPC